MKKIIIKTETIANYIGHLLSIAEIGFQNNHKNIYLNTVSKDDVITLKKYKNLLAWQDGFMGELTWYFVFFLNYLNPESKADLEKYFELLNQAMEIKTFATFKKFYQHELEHLSHWTGVDINGFEHQKAIKEISEVYLNNYATFLKEVLPNELPKINKKISEVQTKVDQYDFIKRWENLTRLEFKFNTYTIVLGLGIENGPNANSLGYEKNWFSYETETENLIPFICHETGTHISIDMILSVIKEMQKNPNASQQEFTLYYQGYENIISYFNRRIVAQIDIGNLTFSDYNGEVFFKIFETLQKENPHFTAIELYHHGVEAFKKLIKQNHKN